MEQRRQAFRLGAACIVLAAALRLVSAGFFTPFFRLLQQPQVVSFFLYLETGQAFRFSPTEQAPPLTQPATEATQPPETQPPEPEKPVFSQADMEAIAVNYQCDYRPELAGLLEKPLQWDLRDGKPAVLILHSHATETYTGEEILYSGTYRTLQQQYNMVSIGREVARVLEQGGIRVIHDPALYDHPSYSSAYSNARSAILKHLQENPSIRMVLDIHRDASETGAGQLITTGTAGGQTSAQLMMVVGTDAGGNAHPNWQENLSLALKLTALLERNDPGITRPIDLRAQRFNMDLSRGGLLIEVGAAGNTHEEAVLAANALAQSILQLAQGTGN